MRPTTNWRVRLPPSCRDSLPVVYSIMNGVGDGGQLLPRLRFPLEQGYLHATRYRGEFKGQPICNGKLRLPCP